MSTITTPYIPAREIQTELVCKKARVACTGYDNGLTPGSSLNTAGTPPNLVRFNWEFISKGVSIEGVPLGSGQQIGATTGWTPQFTDNTGTQGKEGVNLETWVPYLNSLIDPEKSCWAFGVAPARTWRYAKLTTIDPCLTIGKWQLCRTDLEEPDNLYTVFPVLTETTEIIVWCRTVETKDGPVTEFYDRDIIDDQEVYVPIDQPTWQPYRNAPQQPIPLDCFIPCENKFPALVEDDAVSPCTTREYNLCDFLEDGTRIQVVLFVHDCEGERTREIYALDDLAAADGPLDEEYEVQGNLKNCDDTEFVEPPLVEPDCPVIGVHLHCVESESDPVEKKVGYQVSDHDPGDIPNGQPVTCRFSVTVDDPAPMAVITPIPGYSFTQSTDGNTINFVATFGNVQNNPEQPLEATLTCSDGRTAVLTGSDFQLCSGGGASLSLTFGGTQKSFVKELCHDGKPSTWQDENGNVIEKPTGFCPTGDDSAMLALLQQIADNTKCDPVVIPT